MAEIGHKKHKMYANHCPIFTCRTTVAKAETNETQQPKLPFGNLNDFQTAFGLIITISRFKSVTACEGIFIHKCYDLQARANQYVRIVSESVHMIVGVR